MLEINGTPYEVDVVQIDYLNEISERVKDMRSGGKLNPVVLGTLRKYFKIKNIYHSNAIEGNSLNVGETRQVVEHGLTITGKSLKDQAEARNLSAALDYLEALASDPNRPITENDIRQIHLLVLKGIDDDWAGRYRLTDVEISGSNYKPPKSTCVSSDMQSYGEWLKDASVPGIIFDQEKAILAASVAHTWFVMIHPFIDGNGRVARLLMNLILMRYGFPIAIISREDRNRYYDALESSQAADLTPFVSLIIESVEESLEEYENAAEEQRENLEWARSIASKFDNKEKIIASNEYEVWKSAMDLLRSHIRQKVDFLKESSSLGEVYFHDYGMLEFEKYLSLRNHGSAKKTWFFRIDFKSGTRPSIKYLFFFGSPNNSFRQNSVNVDVTLHVSREEPPGSFRYERLDAITAPNVPLIVEIGYKQDDECFVFRIKNGSIRKDKIDSVCKQFITDVIEKHFG
jgi:Fic family protein